MYNQRKEIESRAWDLQESLDRWLFKDLYAKSYIYHNKREKSTIIIQNSWRLYLFRKRRTKNFTICRPFFAFLLKIFE